MLNHTLGILFLKFSYSFRNAMRHDLMSSSIKKEMMNGHKDSSCSGSFKKDPFTSMLMRDNPLTNSHNEGIGNTL